MEIGWYNEDKRKNENTHNLEDGDGETENRKRFRVEETEHRGISLGCLSLKQSEEVDGKLIKMKKQLEESMMQWQDEMYAERRKWQKESDIMFNKIKTLEEDKARHSALWAKAEQKIKEFAYRKRFDHSSSPVIRSSFAFNPTFKLHWCSKRMPSSSGISSFIKC